MPGFDEWMQGMGETNAFDNWVYEGLPLRLDECISHDSSVLFETLMERSTVGLHYKTHRWSGLVCIYIDDPDLHARL